MAVRNDAEPCSVASECPGGTCIPLCRSIAGQLRNGVVQAVGEAECAVGPVDQRCAGGAGEVGCSDTQPCPPGLGPCLTDTRRCFLDPIVREGMEGTTMNVLAATFCIPATTSPAVNSTAGLPGAGSIRFGNTVTVAYCGDNAQNRPEEECDGSDAANCPGSCGADCTCQTVCGNGNQEFGEQCDPGGVPPGTLPDDSACPGTCIAAGMTNECTCTAQVCGDGFAGPGEQCDPGGVPPGTLPDDDACPGQCLAGTCTCPPPVCGDGIVNGTEICELPQIGCGPLQICVGCTACLP